MIKTLFMLALDLWALMYAFGTFIIVAFLLKIAYQEGKIYFKEWQAKRML